MKKNQKRNIIYKKIKNKLLDSGLNSTCTKSSSNINKLKINQRQNNKTINQLKTILVSGGQSTSMMNSAKGMLGSMGSSAPGQQTGMMNSAKGMLGSMGSSAPGQQTGMMNSAKGMLGSMGSSAPGQQTGMMNSAKGMLGSIDTKLSNPNKNNTVISNLVITPNQKKNIQVLLEQKKKITNKIIELSYEKKKLLNKEKILYEKQSEIINTSAMLKGINLKSILKNDQSNSQFNGKFNSQHNDQSYGESYDQTNDQSYGESYDQTNDQFYSQSYGQSNNQSYSQSNDQSYSQSNDQFYDQNGGTLQNELNNIIEKKTTINEKIIPLEKNLEQINIKLMSVQGGLFDKSTNKMQQIQDVNNKEIIQNNKEIIQNNKEIIQNTKNQTFMEKIKSFFKSDFFIFMKYYLYFIILFAIIFYITIRINNNTKNSMIIIETKIFFYVSVIILFIIINDILETPVEALDKFLYVLLFTLIALYTVTYLVEHYYPINSFFDKLKIVLLCAFIIFIIMVIYIYFHFQKKDKNVAADLFDCFNYGVTKNLVFTIFLMLYLFFYYMVFYLLSWNSSLTDILLPFFLGVMLIFFIFCLIIYIALKMKIINRIQVLNTYIALFSIFIFLSFVCAYIFMSSLKTICTTNESVESLHEQEIVTLIIIASIFTILWLDDSRNWGQIGSIFFLVASIITLYCTFYYSVAYPSTGTMSFWLFIEWLIIVFYRKENSKNSIHYSFMKV